MTAKRSRNKSKRALFLLRVNLEGTSDKVKVSREGLCDETHLLNPRQSIPFVICEGPSLGGVSSPPSSPLCGQSIDDRRGISLAEDAQLGLGRLIDVHVVVERECVVYWYSI